MIDTTFNGDLVEASNTARLFMAPGMGHCRGGPGPNDWDKLTPIVEWVENDIAPDFITAEHSTNGLVDNQRPVCAYPQEARYIGPMAGANDSVNWIAENFQCR